MAKTQAALKRVMLGRPMSSGELEHTLLPKWIALPVFSSDALSSVAYATQEILLVLGAVSLAATDMVVWVSIAVACLLTLVVRRQFHVRGRLDVMPSQVVQPGDG